MKMNNERVLINCVTATKSRDSKCAMAITGKQLPLVKGARKQRLREGKKEGEGSVILII